MNKKSKYIDFANELKRYLSGAEYRSMPAERAFIKWYMLAKYGVNDGAAITDGKKDGGIDAVFDVDNTRFVIQSKYEIKPRLAPILRDELGAFEEVANKILNRSSSDDFNTWIKTVRPELRPTYTSIRQKAMRDPSSVRFIFITTKRLTLELGDTVEVDDIQHITALWDLHSRGFTPPVENMVLTFEHEWEIPIGDGFKTHVGLADTSEFIKLMEDDKNERLFAQNVRTDLGSQINKGIKKTYETDPDRFWLYNNGLYIICSQIDYLEGRKRKLKYPSIINGSQTLHSIKHASKQQSCKILVRLLVMDTAANPELLSAVIRRTNTQNPMKLINLSSQDPFQLNIARYLDRFHIFYERREKEWANEKKSLLSDYIAIGVKDVTQWLSLLYYSDIGFGLARTKVSDLFQPIYYNRIFSSFDTHFSSSAYKDLALIVWAGFFTKNMIKSLPKSFRAFGQMAQLVLIRATYDAIKINRETQESVLRLLNSHMFGNASIHASLKNWYRFAVKDFVVMQKKAQRKDAQLDFSNYFKRNALTLAAYKGISSKKSVQKLNNLLIKHLFVDE